MDDEEHELWSVEKLLEEEEEDDEITSISLSSSSVSISWSLLKKSPGRLEEVVHVRILLVNGVDFFFLPVRLDFWVGGGGGDGETEEEL